jgi:hypothetical protein
VNNILICSKVGRECQMTAQILRFCFCCTCFKQIDISLVPVDLGKLLKWDTLVWPCLYASRQVSLQKYVC